MTKAAKKTTGRNLDAEDKLSDKLGRAQALVHTLAMAVQSPGLDQSQLHLALESVYDLLNDAHDALGQVQDVLEDAFPPREPEPVDDKPMDKATGKRIIATVRKAMKPPPKPAKKKAAPNGANGTQMPGEQSLDFGGGAQ